MRKQVKQRLEKVVRWLVWYSNTGITNDRRVEVLAQLNAESARSSVLLCYFFAFLFGTYGFFVTPYLQRSMPLLTVWDNTYPRILLSVLPILLLSYILKKTSFDPAKKILTFYVVFSFIFLATAHIHIWTAATDYGDEFICALMLGPNALAYLIISAFLAPTIRVQLAGTASLVAIFWIPYYRITERSSRSDLFAFVEGSIVMAIPIGIFVASKLAISRAKMIENNLSVKSKAKESVNSATANALFDSEYDYKQVRERKGVFSVFDLRGSTRLKKLPGGQKLIREFVEMGMACALRNGAEIINDRGDGYFLFFGPEENKDIVDLDDIPSIQTDLAYADRRLYSRHFQNYKIFLSEMEKGMSELEERYGLGPVNAGFAATLASAKYYFLQAEGKKREHWDHDVLSLLDRLEKLSKVIKENIAESVSVAVFHAATRIFWRSGLPSRHECEGEMDGHETVQEVDYLVLPKDVKMLKQSA